MILLFLFLASSPTQHSCKLVTIASAPLTSQKWGLYRFPTQPLSRSALGQQTQIHYAGQIHLLIVKMNKAQQNKMNKSYTFQTFADELLECVWPFCGIGA